LPDTRNARELILPFDVQFNALADISKVPRANIYYRAVQIMEELAPWETWNAQGEDRLRAILASAGLKFSFRRPRALLARRALFHLIGELLDARRISSTKVAQLEPLLTFDDRMLLLIEHARRPDEVLPIPRGEKYSERNEQWLERIEETRQLARPNLESGWRVIAEKTTLKILDWEVPTETRRSVVCSSDAVAPQEELLTKIPASQIDAYWDLDVSGKAGPLAIQNEAHMYDTIGANWIGFNPKVARDLGWRPGTESMLSWEDGSGQILAKTIWWADGTIQHYPPALKNEIGEGWLVVVSPEAWEVLKRRFTTLVRVGRIERQFIEEEKVQHKTLDYIDVA
jgi:hypothetical protein